MNTLKEIFWRQRQAKTAWVVYLVVLVFLITPLAVRGFQKAQFQETVPPLTQVSLTSAQVTKNLNFDNPTQATSFNISGTDQAGHHFDQDFSNDTTAYGSESYQTIKNQLTNGKLTLWYHAQTPSATLEDAAVYTNKVRLDDIQAHLKQHNLKDAKLTGFQANPGKIIGNLLYVWFLVSTGLILILVMLRLKQSAKTDKKAPQ